MADNAIILIIYIVSIVSIVFIIFFVCFAIETYANNVKKAREKKEMEAKHNEEMRIREAKDMNSVIELAQKYEVNIGELIELRKKLYSRAARSYSMHLLTNDDDSYYIKDAKNYIEEYKKVEKVIFNKLRDIPNCASARYMQLLERYFNEEYKIFKISSRH